MVGRHLRRALVVALLSALLAGCGSSDDSSADDRSEARCEAFDDLVTKVDSLTTVDLGDAAADELNDQAADVEDQLDEVESEADGIWESLIASLRTAVRGFIDEAVATAQEERDVAQPLLEDKLDDVRQAWATLQKTAEKRCGETS